MSSRSLGSLVIDLIAKVGGFEQGMDKAARVADKRMKEIERSAKVAGAAIGTALVVGAGVVTNQIRKTIDSMDELSKAAARANLPTEEFSKLAYAGDLADVAIQDLQSSMGRLAKAQADAQKETSQQARIFEELGIATRDAEGRLRNTYDVFLDFADAFKRNQGSPETMAAGLVIFGRSFQNLVPMIKDGAQGLRDAGEEAEKLGHVLSAEAGRQAEEFNDNITRVQKSIRGMWMEVATRALPQLTQLSAELATAAKNTDLAGSAVSILTAAFQAGVWVVEQYGNAVARTSIAIETMVGAAEGLREIQKNLGPGGLFNDGTTADGIRKVEAAFENGQRRLDALIARQNNPFRNVVSGASTVSAGAQGPDRGLAGMFGDAPKRGGARNAAAEAIRETQRARDELERQVRAVVDARREWDAWAAQLAGPVAEANYQFSVDMERLNELARNGEVAAEDLADAQAKLRTEHEKNITALQAQLTPAQEALRLLEEETAWLRADAHGQRELAAARLLGADATAEQIAQAIESMRVNEALAESIRNMDQVRGQFSDFFTDTITGAKSVGDAFKDMADNIAGIITRMIADQWVEQLFGGFGTSGAGTTGGGWMSALAGLFGGGKANGGWAQANTMYEVNERGLEMATVRGRDYLLTGKNPVEITPNHRLASGGGVTSNNTFYLAAPTDKRTQQQIATRTAFELKRAAARA